MRAGDEIRKFLFVDDESSRQILISERENTIARPQTSWTMTLTQ